MWKKTEKDGNKASELDLSNYDLTSTDKKVFIAFIKNPNKTQNELAELLNISFKHFSKIKNKPAFQRALNDHYNEDRRSWIQILIDARPKASKKLVELIDCDNLNVSIRATENILQLDKLDLSDDKPEEEPY